MDQLNSNGTRQRRNPGELEFSEMHRLDLPKSAYLTDFDSGVFTANERICSFVEEQNTFIEYAKAGWNVCAFKAIFDLKKANSSELEDALNLSPFSSVWAQHEAAKRLHCRFFIVSVNGRKKEPPYCFYEVMSDVVRQVGVLEYNETTRRKNATEFWVKLGLISASEAAQHLAAKEGNFEVEAIYLNEKNQFVKRYFSSFPNDKIANDKFKEGLTKLRASKTNALVTLRQLKENLWHLIKSERT